MQRRTGYRSLLRVRGGDLWVRHAHSHDLSQDGMVCRQQTTLEQQAVMGFGMHRQGRFYRSERHWIDLETALGYSLCSAGDVHRGDRGTDPARSTARTSACTHIHAPAGAHGSDKEDIVAATRRNCRRSARTAGAGNGPATTRHT